MKRPLFTLLLALPFAPLGFSAEPTIATPAAPATEAPDSNSAAGLWKQIVSVYFMHPATKEEAERQTKIPMAERSQKAKDLCQQLIKQFPDSPERWDAELEFIDLRRLSGQMKLETFSLDEAGQAYSALLANPALPEAKRPKVLVRKLSHDLTSSKEEATPAEIQAFAMALGEGIDRYGAAPFQMVLRVAAMKPGYIQALLESKNPKVKEAAEGQRYRAELMQLRKDAKADPDKTLARLKELSQLPTEDVAAAAKAMISEMETEKKLQSAPMELAFTAVDGTEVDLSKMRGKVILVDFWATWCGPCMAEVPHVVETYQKLHDKGFEIIGVSLDKEGDLSKLKQVTKAKGMVWPQHYDGKGWQTDLATKYGIHAIPAMWLINKKGMLVDMNAREDLAGKVEKLLAE